MATLWIVMRPMDNASLIIPLVLTVELDLVPVSKVRHPPCKINVVRYQQHLP